MKNQVLQLLLLLKMYDLHQFKYADYYAPDYFCTRKNAINLYFLLTYYEY